MALTTQIAVAVENGMIAYLATQLNAGFLDLYTAPQPAGPGIAISGQVKLARLALSATAFGTPVAGVATANAITASTALASGTAAFYRGVMADGTTAVIDGSVGTAGTNLVINSLAFVFGAPVSVSGWTLTMPAAGA